MRFVIVLIFILKTTICGLAQDSLKQVTPSGFKYDTLVIHDKFPALRIGIGLQKSFYSELGISYNKIYGSNYGHFGCYDFFASAIFIPRVKTQKSIYGAKVGAEGGTQGSMGGIEVLYLSDNIKHDVMITPKLGLGLFTYLVLSYGYSFSTNNRPFHKIGRHQFSIVSNLPPLKNFKKKKK